MIKVRIGNQEYEATVFGISSDQKWNNRENKSIMLVVNYAKLTMFLNNL